MMTLQPAKFAGVDEGGPDEERNGLDNSLSVLLETSERRENSTDKFLASGKRNLTPRVHDLTKWRHKKHAPTDLECRQKEEGNGDAHHYNISTPCCSPALSETESDCSRSMRCVSLRPAVPKLHLEVPDDCSTAMNSAHPEVAPLAS